MLRMDNFSVIGLLSFSHLLSPFDNYKTRRVDRRDDDRGRDGGIRQTPSETPWCDE